MSLAEATRNAVRRRPFLLEALRADVVNYTAAARFLADEIDVGDDTDAVSTALSRFADELPTYEIDSRDARVTMRSGLGRADDPADSLLVVGDAGFTPDSGSLTGVIAAGDVDCVAFSAVLSRLVAEDVDVVAAGVAESLVVVVERRDGANAVRFVEDALDAVPERGD
ncbi:hypothetical protein ZOD2009_07854 [Haladaptatus paucihalophilus DX253]|uniref:ACT domain-containing protein n=1 Tax=Haladaptatus paucihalophilus DX253 TaxID=797209 RepID=E7QRZ8_HALPU|nr:hypothetical protein [Haladaptatus paucihalophilus]EFW92767.1 hypothetical protein ZOD2009_07854 [Haladaptatus paucihalophilus DX253]SHK13173.1 hypothetical protein SAMN05444342_0690 [Haladaptatus paucihalophilus DX253]